MSSSFAYYDTFHHSKEISFVKHGWGVKAYRAVIFARQTAAVCW